MGEFLTMDTVTTALLFGLAVNGLLIVILLVRSSRRRDVDIAPILERLAVLESMGEKNERAMSAQLGHAREEASQRASEARKENHVLFGQLADGIGQRMSEIATQQKNQMETFTKKLGEMTVNVERQQEALRGKLDEKLGELRKDNSKKLDEMRKTVDEKLQGTLEKRLGESFKQVSDRLEQVHRGLGEMQTLATGVGDLKRVLTNVKTRGGWGEVQLNILLDEVLTKDQYEANVAVREHSAERVEFAVRLPSKSDDDTLVLLPIDSKFPKEDYERLVDAAEIADAEAVEEFAKKLETRIKQFAKEISQKYIVPPTTTDFAVMFLPTEGLFAEVVRRPGLIDTIQRDYRVLVAGPTTFMAFLNSLQMAFRTLAIQQRSSEVWEVLGAVKTEFGKFGTALGQVKKKLHEASNKMDDVDQRTRVLGRKLRNVEALPTSSVETLVPIPALDDDDDDDQEEADIAQDPAAQ